MLQTFDFGRTLRLLKAFQGYEYPFSIDMSGFIQFQTKMGKKEPSFPQFVLLVKVVFTGTSGKNVFTGKPGLP